MEYVLSDKTGEQRPSGVSQHASKLEAMCWLACNTQLCNLSYKCWSHQAAARCLPGWLG